MNRVSAALALTALLAGGVAAAQTTSPPPQQPPSTTTEEPSNTTASPQSAPNPGVTTDKKAQMKDCITQQRSSDPQLSERDAKKLCKAAVNGSPQS